MCTSMSPAQSRGYKLESDNDTGEPSQGVYLVVPLRVVPDSMPCSKPAQIQTSISGFAARKKGSACIFRSRPGYHGKVSGICTIMCSTHSYDIVHGTTLPRGGMLVLVLVSDAWKQL